MVKHQIEGSHDDEILRFYNPRKADEITNETKIRRFGLKIKEKSLFQNQQKSATNLGKNEEQFDLKDEIIYLNLI